MKELLEYRAQLVTQLEDKADEFCAACRAGRDPFAAIEVGWNMHQLASHTRDVARLVYGQRIRRTADEENPEFEDFNADQWMAAHYEKDEALASILDELSAAVKETASLLRGLPAEAWNRESCHQVYGGRFSLQTWVERDLAHIEEHLDSVRKVS